MQWREATEIEGNSVRVPPTWLDLYYYEALNILFRFENSLRIFAYIILKKELGEKWDNASISGNSTIKSETKKRLAQAREHGYLGYEVSSPMLYLNSGELTTIITSDAYWKHFAPYFKATKQIILNKLNEIGTVRNSLAHFRPLKKDDLDLIKQNTKHVLLEIETCIDRINAISSATPTNNDSEWYKKLSSIKNEVVEISLFQSQDQQWVRTEIGFKTPLLEKNQFGTHYFSYQLGKFRTEEMLKKYDGIRNACICVSEIPAFGNISHNHDVVFDQKISIIFHQKNLSDGIEPIFSDFTEIAKKAEREVALLHEDRLTLGELVKSESANASFITNVDNPFWSLNISNLNTPLESVDSIEFWGHRYHFSSNFVTDTNHYPWMPTAVSKPAWAGI